MTYHLLSRLINGRKIYSLQHAAPQNQEQKVNNKYGQTVRIILKLQGIID
jgi:hypothetical protein